MPEESAPAHQTAGGAVQRQRILDTALSLMSQRGVDGTFTVTRFDVVTPNR